MDFGFGFYTTTNKAQAISFADKVTKRRKNGQRTVSIYEIDENTAFTECSLLRFDRPEEGWLDFVSDNRSGNYEGETYDFILGPVEIKKLYNQLVLTTERALSYLQFVGIVPEEEF